MGDQRRVLITGAGGHVGSFVSRVLGEHYELVLCDRVALSSDKHRCIQLDLGNLEALTAACQDIDTVVHLAADPRIYAEWESILPNNIVAPYNMFEAARQAGCRRVIYASSINTVRGYPSDVQVHVSMPVRPPNLYGASKVWGEALARLVALIRAAARPPTPRKATKPTRSSQRRRLDHKKKHGALKALRRTPPD